MKSKPFSILTALLVAAMSLGSVPAWSEEPAYPLPFSKVDKDQDEHIDLWEARAVRWLPEYMRKLDQDGDGRLTQKEYENFRAVTPKEATSSRPSDASIGSDAK